MLYEDKYPDTPYLGIVEGDILKGKHMKPCVICGRHTYFIDINSECHVCSPLCMEELIKREREYFFSWADDEEWGF